MNLLEYERMYAVEERHWWYRGLRTLVWDAYAALSPQPEGPLLDIGCGTGGTLAGAPGHAVGIDLSAEALRFCRQRGQRRLARANASALPFRADAFQCALMLDVLYHRAVTDPESVLREARRVIAPGGHLILNAPAYEGLRSTHDAAIHTARRFRRQEIHALLAAAGFEPVRITYWNTLLFPAAATVRIARRNTPRDSSDLADYDEGAGTRLADAALGLERALLRMVDLPFGLSVFAVARKSL